MSLKTVALILGLLAGPAGAADLSGIQRPISDLKPIAALPIGKTADWVSVVGGFVWVGSTGPNAVTRVDPRRNAVSLAVTLPGEPCAGLAPGFGALWVPLCGPKPGLAKVDLKTGKLVVFGVAPAGAEGGVAVSADSVWLVTDKQGSLARVDPKDGHVRQTVKAPPGSYNPAYAAGRIYLSRAEGAELTTIDAHTGAILAATATGPKPRFLSAGADAAWTLNQGDGSLTRIDARSHRASAAIALGTPGHGGDITYRDGRVWTTMSKFPLTVSDAKADRVIRQWTGPGGDSLAVAGDDLWLTDYNAGTLTRYSVKAVLASAVENRGPKRH
jgi:virginiamycin B lyase